MLERELVTLERQVVPLVDLGEEGFQALHRLDRLKPRCSHIHIKMRYGHRHREVFTGFKCRKREGHEGLHQCGRWLWKDGLHIKSWSVSFCGEHSAKIVTHLKGPVKVREVSQRRRIRKFFLRLRQMGMCALMRRNGQTLEDVCQRASEECKPYVMNKVVTWYHDYLCGPMYLVFGSWGSSPSNEARCMEVGQQIVEVAEDMGLPVTWSGCWSKAVVIHPEEPQNLRCLSMGQLSRVED